MTEFLAKAEEILEIAATQGSSVSNSMILLDRQGGFRMMDSTGWSLPAAVAEFGAKAVYRIERRGESVRVEGWNGSERCLLQRGGASALRNLLGGASTVHALLPQMPRFLTA